MNNMTESLLESFVLLYCVPSDARTNINETGACSFFARFRCGGNILYCRHSNVP